MSFRLGGTDGVSIVANHWQRLFRNLGWNTITVAGSGPVDRLIPGLSLDSVHPPHPSEVRDALSDVDLVVVENLLTIPMRLPASLVVASALEGRPAILHHHDPPWQRERFAHITELPPTDPNWLHVTINKLTEAQFAERGIDATTIYNAFDVGEPAGKRSSTRAALGIAEDTLLIAHPVRAIERKNIPGALRLSAELGGTYWLSGQPEDGYQDTLESVLAQADCPVIRDPSPNMGDLYAAADVVAFPSTWEGFGNPPIEASIHMTPVAVGAYPVAIELQELGFEWFPSDDSGPLKAFLADPDPDLLRRNQEVARQHLSPEVIGDQLKRLLDQAGW